MMESGNNGIQTDEDTVTVCMYLEMWSAVLRGMLLIQQMFSLVFEVAYAASS